MCLIKVLRCKGVSWVNSMARQHHGVDYVEFSAPDLAAVEAFYSAAFGWRFTARSDSCVAFSGPGLGGCFDHGPARPGGALVTLYSRDLEATLDSVQRAGGHICKGLFAFPGGRRFQFTDPAGYELAVWSDAPPLQDEVQRAQHHAEEERKHAGAKGSAGARSSRPRRVRSRFTARQTAAKFRVVCSPTTKKYRACISALVSDTDSVLVVCAENSEGDVAAAVAAAGGREERVAVSHGSCWDAVSLIELEREAAAGGFNVVCVDLSMCGHTLVADGHALLKMLQSLFESTLHTVLVKSKALERHARAWHNSHSLMCAGLPRHHICQDVQIICAEGVTDYRATIPRVLAAGDRVLEIGCADGVTTQILAAHLKRQEQKSGGGASVIGIDVGPVVVEKARRVQAARMERATAEGSVEEQAICRFEVWDKAAVVACCCARVRARSKWVAHGARAIAGCCCSSLPSPSLARALP
jgi:predicted enzyme related to lactoylglutathione lyase